jgi:AraC-like DNA-binding protein
MRQKGATLQQIASAFGISREAVRRRLSRDYGSTRIQELLTTAELRRLTGSSYGDIDTLKRRGIIQPAMAVGRGRALWPPQTIATIIIYVDRHRCPICHRPVPISRRVYCSRACYIEAYNAKRRAKRR